MEIKCDKATKNIKKDANQQKVKKRIKKWSKKWIKGKKEGRKEGKKKETGKEGKKRRHNKQETINLNTIYSLILVRERLRGVKDAVVCDMHYQ